MIVSVLETNTSVSPESKGKTLARSLFGAALTALLWSGCSATQHRRAADKEVYRIVHQVEEQVFGRTNEFMIDTAYSVRKPQEISPSELIDDRLQTNQRVLSIEGALGLAVSSSRRYQSEKERLYL
ncbi:MAG TPA: hypothetical protein VJW76_11965, partial [Verrucomicrobiae bacterium]|nr:hypothetical protein [Verrucomicrobiae bacterium]